MSRSPVLLAALLVTSFLLGPSATTAAAPIQWTIASGGNDHWYGLTPNPGTWHQSDVVATSSVWNGISGYLVSILSQAESDFLLQWLPLGNYWIGFSDEAQEGHWVWSSGEPAGYTNWLPGEPNNAWPPDGEDFAALYDTPDRPVPGQWNDVPVVNPPQFGGNVILYRGIVEYDPVPEPASLLLLGTGLAGLVRVARRRRQ